MKKKFVLIFVLLGVGIGKNFAQPSVSEIDSFIINKANAAYVQTKLPGILIGTLINGKKKYYDVGFADVDNKIKFDSLTVFEIGSITKTLTAYILTKVLVDHHISDTATVISFLPDSVQTNTSLSSISFLSLLNHTSGLPRMPENFLAATTNFLQPYENYSKEKLYHYLKYAKISLSGKSEYSNLGAGLAGILAENISNKTFEELLAEIIFKPFHIQYPATNSYRAVGYFNQIKAEYWEMDALKACGSVRFNAVALQSYLEGMIYPVNKKSARIISLITTPTVSLNSQIKVARGWHTFEQENKPPIFWHNGGTYGFSSFCAFSKEKKVAVFVVVNSFNKNSVSDYELGFQIIKKLTE